MEEYDEAVEEIKKRRKKRALKVFVTEGLMVLAVILLVVMTTLVAIGYNVKPGEDWTIERTGLVQIQTKPTGASLTIDGESIFGWTNMSRSMTEGEHEIVLSKDGYDTWTKKISVTAGLYHRLNYPRLFLTKKKVEELEAIPEGFRLSFAKDGNIALLYSNEKSTWKIFEVNNDVLKAREVSAKDLFTPVKEDEVDSGVKVEAWSGNSERVLISRNDEWVLFDVKRPDKSVNLSKKYGMKFSEVKIANDSASVLYAVSDGNLRRIEIQEEKISSILVNNVKMFDNLKSEFVFLADDDGDGEVQIGIFKDGEKKDLDFGFGDKKSDEEKIVLEDEEKAIDYQKISQVSLSEYYGDYYLNMVFEDGGWMILRGENIDFDKDRLEFVHYEQFDKAPNVLDVRGDGELFVLQFDDFGEIFDVEAENVVKITTFLDADWLDEHMIYNISPEGVLTVADFDRENQRKMRDNVLPGTEVKISKNNRWIYFISGDNKLSRIVVSD